MNKLALQRILFARYTSLTVKTTHKNTYYYHNGKLVGTYSIATKTGIIL